jgi:hypothetical protein
MTAQKRINKEFEFLQEFAINVNYVLQLFRPSDYEFKIKLRNIVHNTTDISLKIVFPQNYPFKPFYVFVENYTDFQNIHSCISPSNGLISPLTLEYLSSIPDKHIVRDWINAYWYEICTEMKNG